MESFYKNLSSRWSFSPVFNKKIAVVDIPFSDSRPHEYEIKQKTPTLNWLYLLNST